MNNEEGVSPEPDQPVEELRAQEMEPDPEFLNRVRRSIHRRSAASQVAIFSWRLPGAVLREMAGLLRHLAGVLAGSGTRRDQTKDGKES